MKNIEIIKSSKDGLFYFHIKAANGEIIAQSEGYVTRQMAEKGLRSLFWTITTSPLQALYPKH